ncbi:DUF3577 domain-containing protein [Zophobihabitans entericus]|uniref:DUF3577 domain-containing protein n=1 Tax=Zophobihabitans entericus TaxID=1635327 RepID=A0A6G9ID36_9GAMM|nr:DUF3577 domain-containing protein [Zophobihabitans entericus]QIQ22148.1 DUF3577 domain-containing protein [Zophobihabitans entericus]
MTTVAQTTQTNTQPKRYEFQASGLAYVNNIRDVNPENGDSYLSCTLAVLEGKEGKVKYKYINVKVVGEKNIQLINNCRLAVTQERPVLVSFSISDLNWEIFTYKKGEKAGQQGINPYARLYCINRLIVGGKVVYDRKAQDSEASQQHAEAAAPTFAEPQSTTETTTESVPAQPVETPTEPVTTVTESVEPQQIVNPVPTATTPAPAIAAVSF